MIRKVFETHFYTEKDGLCEFSGYSQGWVGIANLKFFSHVEFLWSHHAIFKIIKIRLRQTERKDSISIQWSMFNPSYILYVLFPSQQNCRSLLLPKKETTGFRSHESSKTVTPSTVALGRSLTREVPLPRRHPV